jgi:hypothetical protein
VIFTGEFLFRKKNIPYNRRTSKQNYFKEELIMKNFFTKEDGKHLLRGLATGGCLGLTAVCPVVGIPALVLNGISGGFIVTEVEDVFADDIVKAQLREAGKMYDKSVEALQMANRKLVEAGKIVRETKEKATEGEILEGEVVD